MQEPSPGQVLAVLPDAVVSIDRASQLIYANDAAIRLFGYPREQFLGRTLAETIIPPELAPQHDRGMQRFAESGHGPVIGRRIEITARDAQGRRFPIELCVFLDPSRRGEVFHAMIRDTSDRIDRENAARSERDRLTQLLDSTADAWWECHLGGVTRYGERLADLLGIAVAEIPTADPAHLAAIVSDDRARVEDAWDAHIAGSSARFECTFRVRRPDGGERWLRARGRSVEFDAGRPVRIVGTVADVTEQQSVDDRLRNAQRLELLGLLAGGFAHDLNNLLAAIRGQAALASTEQGVPAPVLESLEAVQLATTKAKALTLNMLALGKPRSAEVCRVAIVPVLEEAVQLVRIGLPKSIRISTDFGGIAAVDAEMDPGSLQQVVLNLALNARDAMPSGGSLRIDGDLIPAHGGQRGGETGAGSAGRVPAIRGSEGGSPEESGAGGVRSDGRDGRGGAASSSGGAVRVRLIVEDTGTGISAEALPRIFEPFFTTKPKGVGTGLGLAVVQQAVTAAGGRVRAESEVGRGTRFTIEIPGVLRVPDLALRPMAEVARRILVIEPHAVLRSMLVEALRSSGHAVRETASLAEVPQPASLADDAASLDAVIADPQGDLGALLAVHARLEHARRKPIVLIVATDDPSVGLPALRSGHIALLPKPFELSALLAELRRLGELVDVRVRSGP